MKEKILMLFKASQEKKDNTVASAKSDHSVFVDREKFLQALKGLDNSEKIKIQNITV